MSSRNKLAVSILFAIARMIADGDETKAEIDKLRNHVMHGKEGLISLFAENSR